MFPSHKNTQLKALFTFRKKEVIDKEAGCTAACSVPLFWIVVKDKKKKNKEEKYCLITSTLAKP